MATIRVANRQRFTQIDRETVNDPRLSLKALGLLLWLLDKPDDWETDAARIGASRDADGLHSIRSALDELEQFGYMTRESGRNSSGQFYKLWTIHEKPVESSHESQNPSSHRSRFSDAVNPLRLTRNGLTATENLPCIEILNTNTETKTETKTEHLRERRKFEDQNLFRLETVTPAQNLCNLLATLLAQNGFTAQVTQQWLSDMEKLLRLDQRPLADVEDVIRWCQHDSFWYKNIRSPKKLREKFERLVADARDSKQNNSRNKQQPLKPIHMMMLKEGIQ